jgi:AcrR family transcriptional regulator
MPFVAEVRRERALGLRERKKQRTRALLMDAAIDLCNRQGFERTTVDQIAAVADVSPRTFSRYFATKEAVVLALIDDTVELAAAELARQPANISHLEALFRAYVGMYRGTKTAARGGLTAERLLAAVRIIMSSPALRQAAAEFRLHAANVVLAKRMGVAVDDQRLKLVATVWAAIIMTAQDDLGPDTDWDQVTIDELVTRVEKAYTEFVDVIEDVRQPV